MYFCANKFFESVLLSLLGSEILEKVYKDSFGNKVQFSET